MIRRCLLLIVVLLIGCAKKPPAVVDAEAPVKVSTDFNRLKSVLAGIRPGEVQLYEGLPSNFWEPDLRERELKQKQTTRIHGQPVYIAVLELTPSDSDQLTKILVAKESYGAYSGVKPCGDFQPDFALEWKSNGGITHALISLECGEVQLFGPSSDLLCDLAPAVTEKLKQQLTPRRKQRPAPAATGS